MDGSNRSTLHSTNISSPLGLALDIHTRTQILYWLNGLGQLESSNLDGSNRLIIAQASTNRCGLAVLDSSTLYYIDDSDNLREINITDGTLIIVRELIHCEAIFDIKIVDQLKQPVGMLYLIILEKGLTGHVLRRHNNL